MENKKRILLVEDTEAILRLTKFRLEKSGFEVITAADGAAAFDTAKKEKPDIILLDFGLPDITGGEVAKKLKNDPDCGKIPIILFTASIENLNSIKDIGVEDGISKPYEPEELLEKIHKYLN